MLDREMAEDAAEKIAQEIAGQTNTKSQVIAIELSNKRDSFWLIMRVGLWRYYGQGSNPFEWYDEVNGVRTTNYSHLLRLRIPETVLTDKDSAFKLWEISTFLATVWMENRYSRTIKKQYVIPHLDVKETK